MEILIRKIQRKGDSFIFKPNSKGGFRFTEELAQPQLTPFQISCINIESKKDRKSGCFWTPDYCYFGLSFSEEHELDINKLLHGSDNEEQKLREFNNHFPEKKWYWYTKPNAQDSAIQTYFLGVRLVSSIVAHYLQLVLVGRLKEAKALYNNVVEPTGLADIVAQADSQLIGKGDNLHTVVCEDGNCFVKISDKKQDELKDTSCNLEGLDGISVSKTSDTPPKTHTDSPRTVGNDKKVDDVGDGSSGLLKHSVGSKKPTLADIKLPKLTSDEDEYTENHQAKTKPTRPIKLPKIGES